MSVYIIKVISNRNNRTRISTVGFKTLEEAQEFILERLGNPRKFSEWEFISELYDYEIIEVKISQ